MKEGDTFTADSGEKYTLLEQVAYRGKPGCTNPLCTRSPSYPDCCFGWHCPRCDKPCSSQGHHECEAAA